MADSRLRWGILSTARIALHEFIPAVRASAEGEVMAVASRDAEKARMVAAEFQIPRAYGSYEALLADPEVDAVYVGLPNNLHPQWTILAAQAGKHVLCEKPLARRAADAERMAAACREAGVLLVEAFMWRFHPQHERVQALLHEGAIGEPSLVRTSVNYPRDPAAPSGLDIRMQPALDGGALMDVGCYAVNVARWALGVEPIEVVCQLVVDSKYGVDMTFGGVLRFPGDRLGMVDASLRYSIAHHYEIVGPEGRIRVERLRVDAHPGRIFVHRQEEIRVEELPPADQFTCEADHFARCVRAGRLLPPAEDGVAQTRVIEALFSSAESGTPVTVT